MAVPSGTPGKLPRYPYRKKTLFLNLAFSGGGFYTGPGKASGGGIQETLPPIHHPRALGPARRQENAGGHAKRLLQGKIGLENPGKVPRPLPPLRGGRPGRHLGFKGIKRKWAEDRRGRPDPGPLLRFEVRIPSAVRPMAEGTCLKGNRRPSMFVAVQAHKPKTQS